MEEINNTKEFNIEQRILNRIKEIEDGKIKYDKREGRYSTQGRIYWEGGYLEILKELKSLLK